MKQHLYAIAALCVFGANPALAETQNSTNNPLTANHVLGALTGTTPVGISVPSCSGTGDSLNWTAGTGFGCNTSTGTVSSVTFTGDGIVDSMTPSSAVTSTGTLLATPLSQTKNTILSGPSTGSNATPTFRVLVGADLPNPGASSLGGVESLSSVSHQWINAISTLGVPSATQPAFTDISGALSSGQLPALPSADIWVGNGSNAATAVTMSGDVTINNAGATVIGASKITTTTINANAVTNAKIATSTANTLAGYDNGGNFSGVTTGSGIFLSGGILSATGSGGTVTTTGTPSTGSLTKFSGSTSVTNGDLTGDVSTSGTLATTVGKVNSVTYPASPSTNTVPVVTGSNIVTYEAVPNVALTALSANQVLGALTATTPSGLSVPSCSATNNALTWTSGTGFGCNTISNSTSTFTFASVTMNAFGGL